MASHPCRSQVCACETGLTLSQQSAMVMPDVLLNTLQAVNSPAPAPKPRFTPVACWKA